VTASAAPDRTVASTSPVLTAEGLTFGYDRDPVLRDVALTIAPGEFVALVGPNGSGKSTLLQLLLGRLKPWAGSVRLFGGPPERLRERGRVGYVPQRPSLASEVPSTVEELVASGRLTDGRWWRPFSRADREAVGHALESVGLAELARRPLNELSGGQQQRAFIAKALAAEPSLLVLDEPTTGVDVEAQEALAALLDRLHRELAVTILYVSHEFGAVERFVERLVLVRGGIVFDGPPAHLPGVWHDPSHVHGSHADA
jgi:zinc transport system ATP-binding protein